MRFSKLAPALLCLVPLIVSTTAIAGKWTKPTIASLKVHLYVPVSPPKLSGKRALMLSLHGCIQTADAMKAGANWQETADEYGMIVALPHVPPGSFWGCWSYSGKDHTRTNHHNGYLVNLVEALLQSPLDIDPNQVYITGLSSGGAQSVVMGCLAPDLFAGVGSAAGPTLNNSSSATSTTTLCRAFAKSYAPHLDTQLLSVIHGTQDGVVPYRSSEINAKMAASLYSAESDGKLRPIDGGGREQLWTDEADRVRVSLIEIQGMGHKWSAGEGPGAAFIDTRHVNYPAYVTEFFFQNNLRVHKARAKSLARRE